MKIPTMPPAQTAEQFAARQTWRYRCVEATGGSSTQLGCILLAALGKSRSRRAFGRFAAIWPDGSVVTSFVNRQGEDRGLVRVCHVDELTANFSGLADSLKLGDEDRVALFAAVRSWIGVDARAIKQDLHFTKGS